MDPETKARLDHGRVLMEIIKQGQYQPMKVEHQVMVIYAAVHDYLKDIDVATIKDFEKAFIAYMDKNYPEIGAEIRNTGVLSEDTEKDLQKAILAFKETLHKDFTVDSQQVMTPDVPDFVKAQEEAAEEAAEEEAADEEETEAEE